MAFYAYNLSVHMRGRGRRTESSRSLSAPYQVWGQPGLNRTLPQKQSNFLPPAFPFTFILCISLCTTCVQCPQRPEEGIGSLRAEVMSCCASFPMGSGKAADAPYSWAISPAPWLGYQKIKRYRLMYKDARTSTWIFIDPVLLDGASCGWHSGPGLESTATALLRPGILQTTGNFDSQGVKVLPHFLNRRKSTSWANSWGNL